MRLQSNRHQQLFTYSPEFQLVLVKGTPYPETLIEKELISLDAKFYVVRCSDKSPPYLSKSSFWMISGAAQVFYWNIIQ